MKSKKKGRRGPKKNNKNMENKRKKEREQENENVKRNVMGKNVPQHTFMRNRKLANRFLFSLQQHGKQAGKGRGRGLRMGGGKWIRWAARERNVVTEAAAFEHLAWLSLCAVLFLFLLANQLADWLNEKLHCECEYECECYERGQRMK